MLFLLSILSRSTANITIASNGQKSPYTIVISKEDPFVNQRLSATQFKQFVQNITGVELPILTDDMPLPAHAIILGNTKYTKQVCKDIKDIDPEQDAFHWKVAGDHIVLSGGRRGLCYGVFEIFERFAGVRFYSTFMFVVPPAKTFEIPADLDFFSEADFFYRESYDSDIGENYLWNLYQRYDTGENYVRYNLGNTKRGAGVHTIKKLMKRDQFPVSKYPERYALIKEGGTERTESQPCLSNEDVYQTVLASVLEKINKPGFADYFIEISQNDGHDYCHCPACTAKFMMFGNRTSGMWTMFLNRICRDVAVINPRVNFRTLAYVNSIRPPKNLKVHPNILIRLCEYSSDHSIPVEESNYRHSIEFMEALKEWRQLTDNIMVWIYSYNYKKVELIHPNWFTIAKDLKTFKKYDIKGTVMDTDTSYLIFRDPFDYIGRQFTCFDKMKEYIHQKMSWYTSLNEDDVMNDFLRGYYGPKAAPYVRQYLDDAYNEVKEYHKGHYKPLYCDAREDFDVYWPLRSTFLDHGYKLWQLAIEAAKTDNDTRFLYNTQTGSISHCMSIFNYHKEFEVPSKWTLDTITLQPSKIINEISTNIPQYCPSRTIPDPRSNRLCNLGFDDDDIYARAYFDFVTKTHTPNIITCGSSKFAAKEGFFYGRGGILQKDNWNYIDYNNGGFDFNFMSSWMFNPYQLTGYHINQTERGNFTYDEATNTYELVDESYTITKKYTAAGDGVKGTFNIKFVSEPKTKSINSVVSVACKLDEDGSSIVWNRGDKWEKFTLNAKEKAQFAGFKNNARDFTIVSPSSKRGMRFQINRDPECVSIEVNRTSKTYRVFIHFRDTFRKDSAPSDVTITPLPSVTIPTDSVVEKENDYFDGIEMFQFLAYEDEPRESTFKKYVGGDEKATSGRAFVVNYIGIDSVTTWDSPIYNVERITDDFYINGIHKGDSYTFFTHVRCDIVDANKSAFTAFYMDDYYGMPWGKQSRKNVSDYIWINVTINNITEHQYFYIQPQSGASKCYIDKFRAVPVKLSPTFKPPRVPEFHIKSHDPMPAFDMYRTVPYNKEEESSSNQALIISLSVVGVLVVVTVVGVIVYFKCIRGKSEEGGEEKRSESQTTILV